jgi:hypothetical protein
MANRILIRRDTAQNWINSQNDPVIGKDPLLHEGEIGFEKDSNKIKIGDGYNKWQDLPYLSTNDLPPDSVGYLKNDGNGTLSWGPLEGGFSGRYEDLTGKPDIPKDVNELSDADGLLTAPIVRILEDTIIDLLPFDFGPIIPRTIRNRLEWLLHTADVDNGTINSPANADYDAGTLI